MTVYQSVAKDILDELQHKEELKALTSQQDIQFLNLMMLIINKEKKFTKKEIEF